MNMCNNKPKQNKNKKVKSTIPIMVMPKGCNIVSDSEDEASPPKVVVKKVATKQDIPIVQERFDSDDEDLDFLQDINTTFLKRRKINELGVGKTYVMEHLERITTKYGPSLLA